MKKGFELISYCLLSLNALSQNVNGAIDQFLKNIYRESIIPGFSVVVVKNNEVFFSKGYGVERIGGKRPFTPLSVIAVGSLTKSFTALAALKLVEKGMLNLDSPVIRYLPWFRTANKDQSDKITTRMLLSNTSGLYSSMATPTYNMSETSMEILVRSLSSIFLYREPGHSYEYSNVGFVVAGLVISKVAGISYASFLDKEIFQPLDMQHTTTKPAEFSQLQIVPGHYPSIKSEIVAKREPDFETGEYTPAGSLLHSCADDIGKYLRALISENKVVDNKIRERLWSSYTRFPGLSQEDGGDGQPFGYGLGWMIAKIEGRVIIFHGGSTGKTSSFTIIDSARNIAASILMNCDMTFIDKYNYPTEFSILNNVLRLTTNLPISAFGKPTVKDPTLNSFEIADKDKGRYEGKYDYRSGGDPWVYFGVDMKIDATSAGNLEGTIYRGAQVVNRFTLDFINESLAVSRNVNIPEYLRFKLTPGGQITSVFFFDLELSKDRKESTDHFRHLTNVYGLAGFAVPDKWKCDVSKSTFSAIAPDSDRLLSGGVTEREKFSFDSLITCARGPNAAATYESRLFSENIGALIWREKTFAIKKGNKVYQCMAIVTENANRCYWFMFTSAKSDFTNGIQEIVDPLLKSFRVE